MQAKPLHKLEPDEIDIELLGAFPIHVKWFNEVTVRQNIMFLDNKSIC